MTKVDHKKNKTLAVAFFKVVNGTETVPQAVSLRHTLYNKYGRIVRNTASLSSDLSQLQSAVSPDTLLNARTQDLGKARLVDLIDNELAASSRSMNPINESILSSVRTDAEPSAADNLQSLIQDCGVSTQQISDLLLELPSEPLANSLINYYFTSM
jgi:hypothetical protein